MKANRNASSMGQAGILAVQLLQRQPAVPAKRDILRALRHQGLDAAPLDGNEEGGLSAFLFHDHMVEYAGRSVPAQCLVAPANDAFDPGRYEAALQQTWDWPEARAAVASCRSNFLVTEFMARGLDPRPRLVLFQRILGAVLSLAPCEAMHWASSERLVNPAAYRQALQAREWHNPIHAAVNVRLFRVENRGPGETVMDTLGLSLFGLPDIQCHFASLPPNEVARVLFGAASYVFEHGDVIQDGHTIQGVQPGQRWHCGHEEALVPPEREVLDINPGPPFAGGDRR